MEILAALLILGIGAYLRNLQRRVGQLEEMIVLLTDRVRVVENGTRRAEEAEPIMRPRVPLGAVPTVERVVQTPPLPPAPPPAPQPARPSVTPPPIPQASIPTMPLPEILAPEPSLADRLRKWLGDEEWETIVGGSLLNKLGGVILVIGIALFLGFSFSHMSPAGRTGIAALASAAVLGAGVWIERRERYKVFARGFIGAGWAGIYATSYAAWALPAAKIIGDPFTGSLIMLAAAAGMVLHALTYRSEAVTAVAWSAAFAALAVTPSSPFAVMSLIPVAVSILYLSARFEWYSMPLFALASTYLTCISRGHSGAPLEQTQPLFFAYWLLFEGFDLLRTKRRVVTGGVEWIYPLNLTGFLCLSYLAWNQQAANRLWQAAACGAVLFLADALARALVRPPASFREDEGLAQRMRAGSYESSIFVSAVLTALGIVGRVTGVWMSVSLAMEAELLYLAGVKLELRFLRRLGISAFMHSLLRIGFVGDPLGKSIVLGHATWNWTPPALLHAGLFYVNRALRQPNVVMSSVAGALVAAAIAFELPVAWTGPAWLAFAMVLFEIGYRRREQEFRLQSFVLLAAGVVATATRTEWQPLAIGLALVYGCTLRTKWILFDEAAECGLAGSGASILLAWLLLFHTVPQDYVALAWCGLAVVVLELGNQELPAAMRMCRVPAAAVALPALFATHGWDVAKFPAPPVWISYFGVGGLALLAVWRTWRNRIERHAMIGVAIAALMAGVWMVTPDSWVTVIWVTMALALLESGIAKWLAFATFVPIYVRLLGVDVADPLVVAAPAGIAAIYWLWHRMRQEQRVALWIFRAALIPLASLIAEKCGTDRAAVGWMSVALVLYFVSQRFDLADARRQSGLLALCAFVAAVMTDIDPPRLWITGSSVAALYACQYLARRFDDRQTNTAWSITGTLLLCAVLYGKISGSLLTVSWGLESLSLLSIGFAARERILRLQGLALLLLCILKLFVYDLRNLETMYRILSFVALGLILLAVSWIYTRFKDYIHRLL